MAQIITDISLGIQVKSYIPLYINSKPCKELLRIHMSEIRNKYIWTNIINLSCNTNQLPNIYFINHRLLTLKYSSRLTYGSGAIQDLFTK